MNNDRIVVTFNNVKENKIIDIDIPLDISVNELIMGLDNAFDLGMDVSNISMCHLQTENPIALLKGNKTVREYGLWNGTIINYL